MLGERIRALRQERQLTVRRLAAAAGVSVGLISQVERGINNPSLDTLRRVAQALDVPLFDLFQSAPESTVAVVRGDDRMQVRSPHAELTYSRVSPGIGRLEVLEGTLEPGAASSGEPWSHPSEECVLVTKGELIVEVDGARHRLRRGDSCYFDSRLPHRYVNHSTRPAVFLVSITPPSY